MSPERRPTRRPPRRPANPPVRRVSQVVFWRRRLVVVGVALAVVLVAVNVLKGGDSSQPEQARQASAQPTATPTQAAPTDSPTTSSKKHRGEKSKKTQGSDLAVDQGPTQPTLVAPVGTCENKDVQVTPSVDRATVGSTAVIHLSLQTKTTPACTWHVSAKNLALRITRFDNEIWSSRLCPNQIPVTDVVLRQAVTSTFDIDWTTRRGELGCPRTSAFAIPGHYRVDASSIGGTPAGSGFRLDPQVIEQPTPSSTSSPTTSPTTRPSSSPSDSPSSTPSSAGPSAAPSSLPSSKPSSKPSNQPSHQPTKNAGQAQQAG